MSVTSRGTEHGGRMAGGGDASDQVPGGFLRHVQERDLTLLGREVLHPGGADTACTTRDEDDAVA